MITEKEMQKNATKKKKLKPPSWAAVERRVISVSSSLVNTRVIVSS